MDNKPTDDEKPSGISDEVSDSLKHGKLVIQPIHTEVIPEEEPIVGLPESINVKEEKVSNSILDNLASTSSKTETSENVESYNIPRYQVETITPKRKPLYGLYVLSLVLLVNGVNAFFFSTELPADTANLFRLLSTIALLMGIGLLTKKEIARIITIALFLFLAILTFGIIQRLIYIGVIIYLNLPKVKDEFGS